MLMISSFLNWKCATNESSTTFLSQPIDTVVFNVPYAPYVLDILLPPKEEKRFFSLSFSKTLNSIFHFEKGKKNAIDTTELPSLDKEVNFYFIKDDIIYACSHTALYRINIDGNFIDSVRLPKPNEYFMVEYYRSYNLQDIFFEDSCILLSPSFAYHHEGMFTDQVAKTWNYNNYAGYYFAKICNFQNDTSIRISFHLDSIMSRFIKWGELASKKPNYDIGEKNIFIASTYHNYIYIVDKEDFLVKDSFKVHSSFYNDPIKGPTTKFDDRFDDISPYNGSYVRWIREVDFKDSKYYIVGIVGTYTSNNTNSFVVQLYSKDFELMDETKFIGNYRSIAYCYISENKLFVPLKSEQTLKYEVYNIF